MLLYSHTSRAKKTQSQHIALQGYHIVSRIWLGNGKVAALLRFDRTSFAIAVLDQGVRWGRRYSGGLLVLLGSQRISVLIVWSFVWYQSGLHVTGKRHGPRRPNNRSACSSTREKLRKFHLLHNLTHRMALSNGCTCKGCMLRAHAACDGGKCNGESWATISFKFQGGIDQKNALVQYFG